MKSSQVGDWFLCFVEIAKWEVINKLSDFSRKISRKRYDALKAKQENDRIPFEFSRLFDQKVMQCDQILSSCDQIQ